MMENKDSIRFTYNPDESYGINLARYKDELTKWIFSSNHNSQAPSWPTEIREEDSEFVDEP